MDRLQIPPIRTPLTEIDLAGSTVNGIPPQGGSAAGQNGGEPPRTTKEWYYYWRQLADLINGILSGAIAIGDDGLVSFNDVPVTYGGVKARRSTPNFKGDHLSVMMFGAKGDGVADDTAAIQAALDEVAARGMGWLHFPRGVYLVSATLNLPEETPAQLYGDGIDSTTITLKDGSNCDVISHANFATLSLSNTAGGIFQIQLRDMTIDGNKAHQTAGYGVRVYGHAFLLFRLIIQNCKQDGLYTEYAVDTPFIVPGDDLEARLTGIKTLLCDGNGWTNRGPHDTVVEAYTSWGNAGWGFESQYLAGVYNGGGVHGTHMNTFLNTLGGIKLGASLIGHDIIGTTATGHGLEIAPGTGAITISKGTFGGGDIGLVIVGSSNNFIGGLVVNCPVGVYLDQTGQNKLDLQFFACSTTVIAYGTGYGEDQIIGTGTIPSGGLLVSTPVPSTGTYILIGFDAGAGALVSLIQFPSLTTAQLQVVSQALNAAIQLVPGAPNQIVSQDAAGANPQNLVINGPSGMVLAQLLLRATDSIFQDTTPTTGHTRLILRNGPGQMGFGTNLLECQDVSGAVMAYIANNGIASFLQVLSTYFQHPALSGPFISLASGVQVGVFNRTDPGNIPMAVVGMAGQYGDLQQWQNSSNTMLAAINQFGNLRLPNLPSASPGAGSRQLYYDPADGNRVKFAP